MTRLFGATLIAAVLAGCSDGVPAPAQVAANGAAMMPAPPASVPPTATGKGTALGLTVAQLEEAELVDAAGRALGAVDRVEIDSDGEVAGLIVELDGDRLVRVPLEGLTTVQDGGGWNVRTITRRADVIASPMVKR